MTLITESTYQQNKCLANTQHENKKLRDMENKEKRGKERKEARKEQLKQKDRERERERCLHNASAWV